MEDNNRVVQKGKKRNCSNIYKDKVKIVTSKDILVVIFTNRLIKKNIVRDDFIRVYNLKICVELKVFHDFWFLC